MALGSTAAFGYSTYALFAMTDAQVKGDMEMVMHYMHEFYFESAAMILTLITVGKMLEARSKGKTTDALKGLMKLASKTAVVERNGQEVTVPIEQVKKGDIFLVRPGENVPVDGVILEGTSALNEAALTGESIPVDKKPGDVVSAATLNQSGFIRCEATVSVKIPHYPRLSRWSVMQRRQRRRLPKIADKVSGVFVPAVITIAVITMIGVAAGRRKCRFCFGEGHFRTGYQLSVCPWVSPHRWRLWWAMVWVPRMVSSLRQLFHWKRQARFKLLPWIRQVPSPTVNRLLQIWFLRRV